MTTEMSKLVETQTGVRLRGVTKTYGRGDAEVHALRGVDVDVEPGDLVVVAGPSGSGKTTLVNIIGGIESATSGEVVVAGEEISQLSPAQLSDFRRDHVGLVFQFFNLIPTLTARENVEVIIELTGRGTRSACLACSARSVSGIGWIISRRSCRVVSSSGSRWRARSRRSPICCWLTSRPVRSIWRPAVRSCSCSSG